MTIYIMKEDNTPPKPKKSIKSIDFDLLDEIIEQEYPNKIEMEEIECQN